MRDALLQGASLRWGAPFFICTLTRGGRSVARPYTEQQVLKKLDIPDFRHLTKEKVIAFLSLSASEHRRKVAWTIWSVFFLVAVGTMAALTFGSDIWFGRPLNITGPYQMANIAVRFYLPLLTIIIPITISSFSKILLKCRKGHEDE